MDCHYISKSEVIYIAESICIGQSNCVVVIVSLQLCLLLSIWHNNVLKWTMSQIWLASSSNAKLSFIMCSKLPSLTSFYNFTFRWRLVLGNVRISLIASSSVCILVRCLCMLFDNYCLLCSGRVNNFGLGDDHSVVVWFHPPPPYRPRKDQNQFTSLSDIFGSFLFSLLSSDHYVVNSIDIHLICIA